VIREVGGRKYGVVKFGGVASNAEANNHPNLLFFLDTSPSSPNLFLEALEASPETKQLLSANHS
jgi:hypothetical protein